MLIDFAQIKNGLQVRADVDQIMTDLDNQPIDYVEVVQIGSAFTSTTLKRTPTADLVTMFVNGLMYVEGRDFTVNRATQTVTWTDADLAITPDVASSATFRFKTLDRVDQTSSEATVYGMILAEEGGGGGTWVRVDQDFNTVAFDAASHGTWANMRTLTLDTGDVVVEIPPTYVKSEVLADSDYAGKTCWWTADGPVEGFHVHPAFVKTDGSVGTLRVGAYVAHKGANDVPLSTDPGTNYMSYPQYTYSDARTYASNKNTAGQTGWRMYSIYDHHLLARLALTEFGTGDPQIESVTRQVYRGVHEVVRPSCWLDGLTTNNGVWNLLAPDGSGTMIATGDSGLIGRSDDFDCPLNCRVDKVAGIDFGDVFIASVASIDTFEGGGSFVGNQRFWSSSLFATGDELFALDNADDAEYDNRCFRLVQVV